MTKTITVMGDSLSEVVNPYWGVPGHLMWPEVMASGLRAVGKDVIVRSFGIGGNTTTQMLARVKMLTAFDIPKVGIIFGGVNDPSASISQATTQSNIEQMLQFLIDAGCTSNFVVSAQYLNFTSGGDTTSTPYAAYVPVRAAQQAAATAKGATFINSYQLFRQRIVDNLDTQGSSSWHSIANNQHFNVLGNALQASFVQAAVASSV